MQEKIRILCEQLLRAQNVTVIELVADELVIAIQLYVEKVEQEAPKPYIIRRA